ncbi:MAG: SulP family inorganic anion transporter [Pirellulales bacterium]|nr:SulP family inorganic anion transporter [Pirellulales bacterium]
MSTVAETPHGNLEGFKKYFKYDFISGFLVFLIALPLCLGISIASGYPPIAGIFTAIVGSIITTLISNSELTIKGPAAGMIVICVGAVTSFGFTGGQDPAADFAAYRMALAVGVVAGVIQVVFGLVKAGTLGDFFPTSTVHGMLAAIGVIIMLKQLPVAVGQSGKGEPLEILRDLPERFANANPDIAVIGVVSLAILFGLPILKKWLNNRYVNMIPAPMVVLLVAIPLGMWFDLSHAHTYTWGGHEYKLSEKFLVPQPGNLLKEMAHPDFSVFANSGTRYAACGWVLMFTLIGSLESMLSAKAVDMIDPWKRKTNLNRDLVAVGIANTAVSFIGGLPMISEIVRSKANVDNGARTRFADLWHGVFLLGFVALAPALIHRIPHAALAAMLVYTGFRLASPREFINVFKVGPEQLLIFVCTIIGVLATDLLIGIGIGIAVKAAIHLLNGVPITSMYKAFLEVTPQGEDTVIVSAKGSAVFTNWIPFKRQLEQIGLGERNNIIVDLSGTKFVDHSVMEKLHEMESDFQQEGLSFEVVGLDAHQQFSAHPHAARKRGLASLRRITIIADASMEKCLEQELAQFGARQYIATPCRAAMDSAAVHNGQVRIEVLVPRQACEEVFTMLREKTAPNHSLTACVEDVQMMRIVSNPAS